MNKKDFEWLTSCVSWIEDNDKRMGTLILIKDSYYDDPTFDFSEFEESVKNKLFLNHRDRIRMGVPRHHVSSSCVGESCNICGDPSKHKVGEEILWDDPAPYRHNFTAYVCCDCFEMIMGSAVFCKKIKDC